ncbi:hypothetical protein DLAC_07463 [Tieghemostelium lacteum]|uniref:Uncharacterized protein n=1 Tax=Tieghemostelium lacteum TaxID=361077 RepID=A0A151ZCL1_TIELA|nr:hypothetical protein DLAC_07463 [Tieghemostelium lacteum]|eukprot:KYQ91686.1 hypothetical protein DLAC_07463 [Tieghemostelium lacteum]
MGIVYKNGDKRYNRINKVQFFWTIKLKPKIERFFCTLCCRNKDYQPNREYRKKSKCIGLKRKRKDRIDNCECGENQDLKMDERDTSSDYIRMEHFSNIKLPNRRNSLIMDSEYYSGKIKEMRTNYENELNSNSLNQLTKYQYAKVLSHSQIDSERQKAILLLKELLQNDNQNKYKYLYELGASYYRENEFELSRKYFDEILEGSPLNREALTYQYLLDNQNQELSIRA